jgi:hypothetical protein
MWSSPNAYGGVMERKDFGNETTVRGVPFNEASAVFGRRQSIRGRLIQYLLPVLWALALIVAIAVLWWLQIGGDADGPHA